MVKVLISGLFVLSIILGALGWYEFLYAKVLPPTDQIKSIVIYYSESDDDYEPKEFKLSDENDIANVRDLIGDIPISKLPLIDSEQMDSRQSWIINIYFKDAESDFRYIAVDKKQVSGTLIDSSPLYEFLRKKYT